MTPILNQIPAGDGHGIFIIPGLGASDRSTFFLRRFLEGKGYQCSGWGMGRNLGVERSGGVNQLNDKFMEFQAKTGGKVSLIGWSLGGVHARRLARLHKDIVRQVISLGSPINGAPIDTRVWEVYQQLNRRVVNADRSEHGSNRLFKTIEIPSTSIYSKSDGIVPWRFSLEKEAFQADNIEVVASHIGLGVNPSVFYIIANRLALPDNKWKPFNGKLWKNRLALTTLDPFGAVIQTLGKLSF
ncbi:MAG: pimeloyl-ACP methyl ester carboxylesterase [Oceanicoccus sp.]|jgi:pimeloyl-ACP methyl ester carboxylesterase